MNRAQQIRKALELLAPPRPLRAECQRDINEALKRIENEATARRAFRISTSKKGRAAIERYLAAQKRTRIAYSNLDPAIKRWFSLSEAGHVVGTPTLVDREIELPEGILEQPPLPPRKHADRNEIAVDAACDVLEWWGRKIVATRNGEAEQLAKILAGDLKVDLFDYLRKAKRRDGVSIEKVRASDAILYRRRRP